MINVLVWKDIGHGSRESAGMRSFEFLPQIGHSVELFDPHFSGRVIDIIHSSSQTIQQTEVGIEAD